MGVNERIKDQSEVATQSGDCRAQKDNSGQGPSYLVLMSCGAQKNDNVLRKKLPRKQFYITNATPN